MSGQSTGAPTSGGAILIGKWKIFLLVKTLGKMLKLPA